MRVAVGWYRYTVLRLRIRIMMRACGNMLSMPNVWSVFLTILRATVTTLVLRIEC